MWNYVTEYVTYERAQKVYIVVIYTYTLYSCANSYYRTASNVFRVARFGYIVSNSVYQKWLRREKAKAKDEKGVELSEVTSSEPVVNVPIPPSDLYGVVENYFTS